MTKVIAIANQKGGVGKTSTTVNLGAGLVRQGYDVLLIDLDSQANLTMALGFQNPDDMVFTISNMMHILQTCIHLSLLNHQNCFQYPIALHTNLGVTPTMIANKLAPQHDGQFMTEGTDTMTWTLYIPIPNTQSRVYNLYGSPQTQ